LALTTHPI